MNAFEKILDHIETDANVKINEIRKKHEIKINQIKSDFEKTLKTNIDNLKQKFNEKKNKIELNFKSNVKRTREKKISAKKQQLINSAIKLALKNLRLNHQSN